MIKYSDFIKANNKIKKYKVPTLLQSSKTFSRMSSNNIYLKPENLQVTGSYKLGGALNVIMNLTEDQKKRCYCYFCWKLGSSSSLCFLDF